MSAHQISWPSHIHIYVLRSNICEFVAGEAKAERSKSKKKSEKSGIVFPPKISSGLEEGCMGSLTLKGVMAKIFDGLTLLTICSNLEKKPCGQIYSSIEKNFSEKTFP